MNYKCQPVAIDLEQTINVLAWRMLVEEPSRFMDQNGNKYLMHWDQKFKYSSAVTKQPNVDAKLSPWGKTICYVQPHGDRIFNLCWSLRELGGQMF